VIPQLVAVVLAVCVLLASPSALPLELPELAARTRPSVVHLKVMDATGREVGSGSGFFVEGNRVVTNEHVVGDAAKVTAKLSDGRELPVAGLLAADSERDLAIVAVVGNSLPPPLKLGSAKSLRQGEEVVIIGSPRGLAGTMSTGIVSAIRGEGLDAGAKQSRSAKSWGIQTTAAISPGSSGSPIMTRDGTVVAVAVGIVGQGGNLGFGVPVEEVMQMLETIGAEAAPEPFADAGASSWTRNLIISAAFFGVIALAFVVPGVVKNKRRRKR